MSVLNIAPGMITPTINGEAHVLKTEIVDGRWRAYLLEGNDAVEVTLGEFLARLLPTPPAESYSRDAVLQHLDPRRREVVERRERQILQILNPSQFDPSYDAEDPINRYSDHWSEPQRILHMLEDSDAWRASVKAQRALGAKVNIHDGPCWRRAALYERLKEYKLQGVRSLLHKNLKLDPDVVADTDPEILKRLYSYHLSRQDKPKLDLDVHYNNVILALADAGIVPAQDTPQARAIAERTLPRRRFDRLWSMANGGAPNSHTAKQTQTRGKKPSVSGVRHEAHGFAGHVECDGSPCDFMVLDDDGVAFRPYALFGVCSGSRYVWIRLTPGPPRAVDYQKLMFDITHGVGTEPGSEEGALVVTPQYVAMPGLFVFDHGKEGENHQIAALMATAGIQVYQARPRTPVDKPRIESFIRQFAVGARILGRGYVGNSVANSGAERVDPSELHTFEWAQSKFRTEFAHWYNNKSHEGLTTGPFRNRVMTPVQMVGLLGAHVPLRIQSNPNATYGLLPSVRLTPAPHGVEYKGLVYIPASGYEETIRKDSLMNGKGPRQLTFHITDNHKRLLYNSPGTTNWIILDAPGGPNAAVRPWADLEAEVKASLGASRRPTKRQKAAQKAELANRLRVSPQELARERQARVIAAAPRPAEALEIPDDVFGWMDDDDYYLEQS